VSAVVSLSLLTEVFVTLFVIMDPIGTIPLFLSLTRGRSHATTGPDVPIRDPLAQREGRRAAAGLVGVGSVVGTFVDLNP